MRVMRVLQGLLAAAGLAGATAASADWALNLPVGVTPISHEAYDLHMLILWICVVIGILVFGAMLISIVRHRKSVGATPAQFHHSTAAEILWTIVPCAILIGMAWPATHALIKMEDTGNADITIKVTAYQWKWHYDYVEDGVSFYSQLAPEDRVAMYEDPNQVEHYLRSVDHRVVVPVGKKVRLLLTADDVIHAWWVPELGMKKDAIPGFVNAMWIRIEEPGVYRGQCAELCGRDHGFMPIVVEAVSDDAYRQWVTESQHAEAAERAMAKRDDLSREELMTRGATVYASNCAACHQLDGEGVPDNYPPIKGSPVANGDMRAHLAVVLKGRPGTAMRAFASSLTDVELAAVLTYQRNALGNDTGDLIQPPTVAAAREQL